MFKQVLRSGLVLSLSFSVALSVSGCFWSEKSHQSGQAQSIISFVPQDFGPDVTAEVEKTDKENFLDLYKLPFLNRMSMSDQQKLIAPLQVIKKIQTLHYNVDSALYPEKNWKTLYASIVQNIRKMNASASVKFQGTKASDLNTAIKNNPGKAIQIESRQISLNEPIIVPGGTFLLGNGVTLVKVGNVEKAVVINDAKNVVIDGLDIKSGSDYGIYITNSADVLITHNILTGCVKKPLTVIGNNNNINVLSNKISGNGNGGIYFEGDISDCLIEGNVVQGNKGTSNWMAGIVLSGTSVADVQDPYKTFGKDLHFPEAERLDSMLKCPHNIILRNNQVKGNNSSGIYLDGAYSCYTIDNQITGNDKEGMCLDQGSFAVYVSDNLFENNGRRLNQTDEDLDDDFVLSFGRMPDGSARAKLPGISLDNTAYDIISGNRFYENYGSGIKMVRTGLCNIIINNNIEDNNLGENDKFHFFGIELGNAQSDSKETALDFTADYENIICRNMITGAHYSGIFLAEECYINDIFDNTIMDAEHFSMECLSNKHNSSLNNYANKPSRGIWLSDKNETIIELPGNSP